MGLEFDKDHVSVLWNRIDIEVYLPAESEQVAAQFAFQFGYKFGHDESRGFRWRLPESQILNNSFKYVFHIWITENERKKWDEFIIDFQEQHGFKFEHAPKLSHS